MKVSNFILSILFMFTITSNLYANYSIKSGQYALIIGGSNESNPFNPYNPNMNPEPENHCDPLDIRCLAGLDDNNHCDPFDVRCLAGLDDNNCDPLDVGYVRCLAGLDDNNCDPLDSSCDPDRENPIDDIIEKPVLCQVDPNKPNVLPDVIADQSCEYGGEYYCSRMCVVLCNQPQTPQDDPDSQDDPETPETPEPIETPEPPEPPEIPDPPEIPEPDFPETPPLDPFPLPEPNDPDDDYDCASPYVECDGAGVITGLDLEHPLLNPDNICDRLTSTCDHEALTEMDNDFGNLGNSVVITIVNPDLIPDYGELPMCPDKLPDSPERPIIVNIPPRF